MSDSGSPLNSLYPFLHSGGSGSNPQALSESVAAKAEDSARVSSMFFQNNAVALVQMSQSLADVFARGGRLLTMGNGGSSCDAAHLAVEFQHPVTTGRPALPAINLVADIALLSAVANDVGIEHVFVRQLEAHGRSGDALFGFSTSGNSKNLLAAYSRARVLGVETFGLTGGDGGAMAASGMLDHCLIVPSDSIHRVQEAHVTTYHILWDVVHTLLSQRRGKLGKKNETAPS